MRTVHVGPLTVLPGVAGLLARARRHGRAGRARARGRRRRSRSSLWLLLERGLRREGLARLGPANAVTLVRAGLVVAVTALVVQSWSGDVPRSLRRRAELGRAGAGLRRRPAGPGARARSPRLGAAFDMETDAFLILVLSVYVVPVAGAWVLLIGLARYLLLLATAVWPWLGGPVPPRPWAKVVAAVQGVVLVVAAAEVLPTGWAQALLAAALVLLLESFGRQVVDPVATPARAAGAPVSAGPPGARRRRPGAGLARPGAAAATRAADGRRSARDPRRAAGLPGARAGAAAGLGPGARRRRRRAAGRGGDRGGARPRLLRGVRPPVQPADRPWLPRLRAGPACTPPWVAGGRSWSSSGSCCCSSRAPPCACGRRCAPGVRSGPRRGPGAAWSPVWPSSGWSPASAARRSAASRSPARRPRRWSPTRSTRSGPSSTTGPSSTRR